MGLRSGSSFLDGDVPDELFRPAGEVLDEDCSPGTPCNPYSIDDDPEAASAEPDDHVFFVLSSSNLDSVAYEPELELMWIWFKDNDTGARTSLYEYCGVPRSVFDGLRSAGSAGGYHHQHIRCTYEYREITSNHVRDEDCFGRTQKC